MITSQIAPLPKVGNQFVGSFTVVDVHNGVVVACPYQFYIGMRPEDIPAKVAQVDMLTEAHRAMFRDEPPLRFVECEIRA